MTLRTVFRGPLACSPLAFPPPLQSGLRDIRIAPKPFPTNYRPIGLPHIDTTVHCSTESCKIIVSTAVPNGYAIAIAYFFGPHSQEPTTVRYQVSMNQNTHSSGEFCVFAFEHTVPNRYSTGVGADCAQPAKNHSFPMSNPCT